MLEPRLRSLGVPLHLRRVRYLQLLGHAGTHITETVYRHQLKPVITGGAEVMDKIFKTRSA